MNEFPSSGHLSSHDICKECIARHLRVKIIDEGMTLVLCPDGSCKTHLEYQEIDRNCPDRNVFSKYLPLASWKKWLISRYDELLCKRAYESDPLFRWCVNTSCKAGQIVTNGGTIPIYPPLCLIIYWLCRNYILLLLLYMWSLLLFQMPFPRPPLPNLRTIQTLTNTTRTCPRRSSFIEMDTGTYTYLWVLWKTMWEDQRLWSYYLYPWYRGMWGGMVLGMWSWL